MTMFGVDVCVRACMCTRVCLCHQHPLAARNRLVLPTKVQKFGASQVKLGSDTPAFGRNYRPFATTYRCVVEDRSGVYEHSACGGASHACSACTVRVVCILMCVERMRWPQLSLVPVR